MKLELLILLLVCTSCTWRTNDFKQQLSNENLVTLEMDTLGISIMVPKDNNVFYNAGKTLINLNPQRGAIKQFSISEWQPTIDSLRLNESFIFENGAQLKYYTFQGDGGSGGTEFCLKGILGFEDKKFGVTSAIQQELEDRGNPEFCFKYLSTLKSYK